MKFPVILNYRICLVVISLLILNTVAMAGVAKHGIPPRKRININREWKFEIGDHPGAEKPGFADSKWDNINLPHNFSIPYFRSAQWYTGYGWYRKYIDVPSGWNGKRISVEFEGAFREAEVYVNGTAVGTHRGGYTGFTLDITGQLHPGRNVLAVRLNNNWNARLAPRNGDHNFTGGIYRDVYLVVTNPVHVTWYGTYITTPKVSKSAGTINIKTEVKNDGRLSKKYTLKTDIVGPEGKTVASVSSVLFINKGATITYDQTIPALKNPQLWHPQHPFMYKAISSVTDGKNIVDKYETPFGIRWLRWTADSGLFINGEHYYFRGADVHQDHAGWANAITNAAITRDVKMIKDCGMDFIRGSHYPHDPSFSDACDSLGVLLWEENDFWGSSGTEKETGNWFDGAGAYPINASDQPAFEQSVKNDLTEMIRIHRNHPSIIVWSMCNEPFFTDGSTMPRVRAFLTQLTKLAHQLDPSRPVGIGGCQRGDIDKLGDIAGYNGDGARLFLNPGIPNVVTEYGSTISVRPGEYIPGWGDLQQEQFPWRSGQALWCAFDYGTRAGDFGKMGMIDYFRIPKSMWYWYRNEYRHIPPPKRASEGDAAKLKLSADKKIITNTDGTDDVFLMVSVMDKNDQQLSNSPDVTLKIVSGPGEFPTGRSITFSNKSDIFIGDGKAAIEFRSYYGGKTVIKAVSTGLQSDSIVIITKGQPMYIAGKSEVAPDRAYIRYEIPKQIKNAASLTNIAYQKPTRASSEANGQTANKVNDNDPSTSWQPDKAMQGPQWWQVDMESIDKVSAVRIMSSSLKTGQYKIELSKDGQTWQDITPFTLASGENNNRLYKINGSFTGRFLRIVFNANAASTPSLNDVEVYGRPLADE